MANVGSSVCKLKITKTVISFLSVFVMNQFRRFEFPSKMFFHYKAMFKKLFCVNGNKDISGKVLCLSSFPIRMKSSLDSFRDFCVAFYGTYLVFVPFKLPRSSINFLSAVRTRDDPSGFINAPMMIVDKVILPRWIFRFFDLLAASASTFHILIVAHQNKYARIYGR